MRCAAITRAGERCRLDATSGSSYCWSHDPANAERRSARARRGGKARGAGELKEVKQEIREIIADVLKGAVDRAAGAVALQGFNVLLRAVDLERRIKETEEFEERLAALERTRRAG